MVSGQRIRVGVWEHIAADNPQAAARMDEPLSEAPVRLAGYPMLGRPGKVPGTCELIAHESPRLVYELERETIWVLSLVHRSREWPPRRD
ncbi:MAG: type II toxin-antitoxin system RelE/ParE family toxin [Accumulibacter sp.]